MKTGSIYFPAWFQIIREVKNCNIAQIYRTLDLGYDQISIIIKKLNQLKLIETEKKDRNLICKLTPNGKIIAESCDKIIFKFSELVPKKHSEVRTNAFSKY